MVPPHLILTFIVEALLLCIHVSVALLIGRKLITRDAKFRGGFYTIFYFQCLVEYVYFLEGSFLKRMNEYAVFPREWFESPAWGMQWYILCGYISFYLYFSHLLIALNRFTSIMYPLRQDKLWSGRTIICAFVVMFLLPLPLNTAKFFFDTTLLDIGEGYILANVNAEAGKVNGAIAIALSVGTSVLNCCVDVSTFLLYRRLNKRQKRQHLEDYRLLLCSVTGLVAQLPMAAGYVVFYFYSTSALRLVQNYSYAYLVDVTTLSGPVCLLLTSRTTRQEYARFYFRGNAKVAALFAITNGSS